jgi:NitT/TauT family transport system substrate-binding protein
MATLQSRRRFVTNAAWAGAAGLGGFGVAGLGGRGKSFAEEPPPEITTIRFEKDAVICIPPQIADELLRAEGFTDIRYVELTETHVRRAEAANVSSIDDMIVSGEVDFTRDFVPSHVASLDAGLPITILAGLHAGCFEVFGKDDIRSMADLRGRTVGVANGSGDERLLKIMVSLVGLDPVKDIRWVTSASRGEGKIDAFVGLPPVLQDVRACNVGHLIASSITDHPWSQYFCCMLATNTAFAHKYPIATQRVLRAF